MICMIQESQETIRQTFPDSKLKLIKINYLKQFDGKTKKKWNMYLTIDNNSQKRNRRFDCTTIKN